MAAFKQILGGRSRCDHCANPVRWYDNIPVISFILLKTRCRHCSKPISHYHPVPELSSGLYLVAAYLFYGLSAQFVMAAAFGLVLLLLFAYDLRHQLIPNVVVLPAIVAALAVIAAPVHLAPDRTKPTADAGAGRAPLNYLIGGAVGGGSSC
ncbi:MAG: prepilin peptidase [Hymenobacter sp.]